MSDAIRDFKLEIPEQQLTDLKTRLALTRWPEQETVADWSQGAPLARVRALAEYWQTAYDWRRCEAKLNGFGQFKTRIDGLDIHFLHVKSPHKNALPLLMTHGWPGSVIEFHKVIAPLADPVAFGGQAEDAFDVIVPSLPGYGFSGKPTSTGWNIGRTAMAWIELMKRLGYTRWVAQGGDWGSAVTTALGAIHPAGLAGIHVNLPFVGVQGDPDNRTPEEAEALAAMQFYDQWDSAYAKQQSTRPQTLGYALADSPVGQAAWIYEKFYAWTDCDGLPENVLTRDEMLDNIMLYWLNNSAASSARLYWESFAAGFERAEIKVPFGASLFPKEIFKAPRAWADKVFDNIVYWNAVEKGGHFAAFEQPEIFVQELRACFRLMR